MIKLSVRLQRIADDINAGETMADIGTDHGFLPVFLVERGICSRVIMADVSPLSLDKARETARQQGFLPGEGNDVPEGADTSSMMDFRAGDGLSVLKPAEVDSVVIAGMGGKLIRDIMAADLSLTCSFRKFVLQPRIGQGHLRKWLVDNGFSIVREGVVYEGRHIPEIITAISPGYSLTSDDNLMKWAKCTFSDIVAAMQESSADDIRWRIPPWMIHADGPVYDFLIRREMSERQKLENVRRARNRDMELERSIIHDIEYLKLLKDLRI